jgi:ribonucleoside-diphosphate reductase alpha chain
MEAISFHAISASVDLAAERGRYPASTARCGARAFCRSTRSSCWPKPAAALELDRSSTLDWAACASA